MGAPADDATRGEDAGEHVARDSHVVLQAGREEIDVAIPLDRVEDGLFHRDRNVVPLGVTRFDSQSARQLFQMNGARVFDLVDRMAEAHELALLGAHRLDPRHHVFDAADFHQSLQHFGVGTAVQRPFQGTDRTGHRGIEVRQRGGDDSRRERTRVQAMLGVQNQDQVHRLFGIG